MTITTKYNVGDKVWINTPAVFAGVPHAVEVEILCVRIWRNNDIDYMFRANSYASLRAEKYCYETKEEALVKWIDEFAEVNKDGAQ